MHSRAEDLLNLRELPALEPPPGVFERAVAACEQRSAKRRLRYRVAAAAAVVVVAGVAAFVALDRPREPVRVVRLADPGVRVTLVPLEPVSYAPLVEESARLERLLAELPAPPRVTAGTTAGTIVGLEDRIALIDAQLSYAAARDLASPYREALWGERVELMNALVYVRFAQTQGF
jgi:hypothetical protein